MKLSLLVLLAIVLDFWLGEPRRWHPLVGFGRVAHWWEQRLLNPLRAPVWQRCAGCLALCCVVLPFTGIWLMVLSFPQWHDAVGLLTLYFCIAPNSLTSHAQAVDMALKDGDLLGARTEVAKIVSRQTENMTETDVRRATIESILENGADAIFAPLFWFVVAGPSAALLYRLSNTLDAMWGYKNQRFVHFGWAAARWDDLLNWMPARLTALGYILVGGNSRLAWQCWRQQARWLESPNAGPVMVTGAGALNLQLGGPAWYHGRLKDKIFFGGVNLPQAHDIARAIRLLQRSVCLWIIIIALGDYLA